MRFGDILGRRPVVLAAPAGRHFLAGFRSRYDVHLRRSLHPAGLVVLTPDGCVSG